MRKYNKGCALIKGEWTRAGSHIEIPGEENEY